MILLKKANLMKKRVGSFILDWLNMHTYVKVNTSGSTGTPKTIKVKKVFMANSAKATGQHFKLPEKTTALLCLPADYIAGKMMLVRAMVLGWHLDMVQPKSTPLDNVNRSYDFCAMTPFQLDNSLARLYRLKKLIVGGGVLSYKLQEYIKDSKTKVYETYGMTETVTHIAVRRVNPKKTKKHPIPFKTLKNVTVTIDDRNCLIVKAPDVSKDIVKTNDVVDLLTNKRFVWLSRIDNVINSGGLKLYPEQIEEKLTSVIDKPFFIAGIPDEILGRKLALFIEQDHDFQLSSLDIDLTDLKRVEVPKVVFTLPQFERTANGKLQREHTVKKAFLPAG